LVYDRQRVIEVALAEVGYVEKETADDLDSKTGNAGDGNFTKYARDLDAKKFFNGRKQGHPWCAVFVASCFDTAYGKDAALKLLCQPSTGNCGAGCNWLKTYFERRGQWFENDPQPGDVVVFYSGDRQSYAHTGLVVAVDATYVHTVEGNTSSTSGVVDNGGAVARKKYKLGHERIAGYGRPDYGTTEVGQSPTSESDCLQSQSVPSTRPCAVGWATQEVVNVERYRVNAKRLALREGMSTEARVLTRIDIGETVEGCAAVDPDWVRVQYNGLSGYCMEQFLDRVEAAAEAGQSPTTELTDKQKLDEMWAWYQTQQA